MQQNLEVARSLGASAQSFLDFCRVEKGLAANTISSYRNDLERFTGFLTTPAADAGPEVLNRYLASLYDADLSPKSIARHVATLRNFYSFLAREEVIERDPAEFLVPPKQWSTLPKYLNRQEVDRLLAAPPEDKATGIRDRAMLEMLYATGLRVSELCGLPLASVERQRGLLRVIGKGNKELLVPFGESAGAALDRYLATARPPLLKGRASRHLFVTARGSSMTRQSFWTLLKKYGRSVGIFQRLTPHMVGHSLVRNLVEGCADLRSVQIMLGHADISNTQVYTHVARARLREAVDRHHPRA